MTQVPPSEAVAVVVTCEHGGNRVPEVHRSLFMDAASDLDSHRGWDPGALPLARRLAESLSAPLHASTVTRLLVDLNRSPGNPRVFSRWTRALPTRERQALLRGWHAPYRERVADDVAAAVAAGRPVVHLGVHSFTPSWNGAARRPDIALLYDPGRPAERRFCAAWVQGLRRRLPDRVVHRNDPYRGASDGLTTWLRRRHADAGYLGIEVEVNQRHLDARGRVPEAMTHALEEALVDSLATLG